MRYLHSDIETVERVEIIRDLRLGEFDVLVGINLLREGLDIPEVSLVAILDADKEGFLRSERSLIQTIGRAARHINGTAILYADQMTDSMQRAIDETERRRSEAGRVQRAHGITPKGVRSASRTSSTASTTPTARADAGGAGGGALRGDGREGLTREIKRLEKEMLEPRGISSSSKRPRARDQLAELKKGCSAWSWPRSSDACLGHRPAQAGRAGCGREDQ